MDNNKELITIAVSFILVVALAMYMFISQQKNNNMVKETILVKELIEKQTAEIQQSNAEIKAAIDSLDARMDATDEKYHQYK